MPRVPDMDIADLVDDALGLRGADTRPGVGLRDGLPDVLWRSVPAGRFWMGGDPPRAHGATLIPTTSTIPLADSASSSAPRFETTQGGHATSSSRRGDFVHSEFVDNSARVKVPWTAPRVITKRLDVALLCYPEIPTHCLREASVLHTRVESELGRVQVPTRLFYSQDDVIVSPANNA